MKIPLANPNNMADLKIPAFKPIERITIKSPMKNDITK